MNLALLAAAATGVQVGAAIVATRIAVTDVPPLTLAMLRYGIGFLCLLPFVIRQNRTLNRAAWALSGIGKIATADLAAMAALGIGQFAVLIALLNFGLQHIGAAPASLIFSLFPLLTLLLSRLLGREPIGLRLAAGVALSVVGVATSLAPKLGTAGSGPWWGELAVLASAGVGARQDIVGFQHSACRTPNRSYILNRRALTFASALSALMVPFCACAQDAYPSRPIKVIVPYPAGGVVDVQARALTLSLAAELGQAIVVESRPGASGNIAAEAVARSPADGYTLIVSASFIINNPLLETNLRWAPKDFVPISRFSLSPSYLCVPIASTAHTVKEFVELAARAKPVLQYGDGGAGTPQTMATEILKSVAKIQMEAISYKGAPPMMVDLINGTFAVAVVPSSVAYPQIKAGKVRALANVSSKRSAQLPDVPTIAEAGFPEVSVTSWYGLHAPAGTPADVLKKLDAAIQSVSNRAEVKERLTAAGGESSYLNTGDFTSFLRTDSQTWERINKTLVK